MTFPHLIDKNIFFDKTYFQEENKFQPITLILIDFSGRSSKILIKNVSAYISL